MKNFLFLYRADFSQAARRSPEEMQNNTKMWMDWIGGIAAQNKLADRGNRLEQTGKVVRPDNVVTDGPFTEIKETLGGYTVIKADTYEEAAELAQGCPVLKFGGNVEIREISVL